MSTPSPFERIGGSEAVHQAVDLLYEKLFGDGNCRQFFEQTDMRKLKAHQVQFIGFALGSSGEYEGKSMVAAHQNLKGLQMIHFNAVEQYLKEALEELNVSKDIIDEVTARVESLRPQFEEAVKTANGESQQDKESAFERVGGAPTVKAAVDLLYEKLLSDGNCRQFFEDTDMRRLKSHQVQFIRFALGGSDSYKGKDMVVAHRNLKGLKMTHFESVARHLAESLRELDVPQGLIDEVLEKVGTLRPQFEKAVEVANQ